MESEAAGHRVRPEVLDRERQPQARRPRPQSSAGPGIATASRASVPAGRSARSSRRGARPPATRPASRGRGSHGVSRRRFCASRMGDPLKLKRPFSMRFENGINGKWQQRTAGCPAHGACTTGCSTGTPSKEQARRLPPSDGATRSVPAAVAQLERVAHASAELDRHPDRRARFRERDDVAGDGLVRRRRGCARRGRCERDFAPRSRSGRRETRGAC